MSDNLLSNAQTQDRWLTLARWLVLAYALAMLVQLFFGLHFVHRTHQGLGKNYSSQ